MTNGTHARLIEISELILQLRGSDLRRAAHAKALTEQQILALVAYPSTESMADLPAAQMLFAYEAWARQRRAALKLQLELREIEWQSAHTEASRAFARRHLFERMSKANLKETRSRV